MLVVDPSGDLADVPGLVRLLADGTHVGVSGICVDDRIRRLPGLVLNGRHRRRCALGRASSFASRPVLLCEAYPRIR